MICVGDERGGGFKNNARNMAGVGRQLEETK